MVIGIFFEIKPNVLPKSLIHLILGQSYDKSINLKKLNLPNLKKIILDRRGTEICSNKKFYINDFYFKNSTDEIITITINKLKIKKYTKITSNYNYMIFMKKNFHQKKMKI